MVAPEDAQAQGRAPGLLISSGVFGAEGADVLSNVAPRDGLGWAGMVIVLVVVYQVPRHWSGAPTCAILCHSASCPGLLFSTLSLLPVLVWYDFGL